MSVKESTVIHPRKFAYFWHFQWGHLPTLYCQRSLQTTPNEYEWQSHSKSLQLVAWKINQGIFSGVREVDDTVRELRKENFNLKLRIYFLEERLGKFLMIIAVWAGYLRGIDKKTVIRGNLNLFTYVLFSVAHFL